MDNHKLDLANGYAEFNGSVFSLTATIPLDIGTLTSSDYWDFAMMRTMMGGDEDAEYIPRRGTRARMLMLAGILPEADHG